MGKKNESKIFLFKRKKKKSLKIKERSERRRNEKKTIIRSWNEAKIEKINKKVFRLEKKEN